MEFFHKQKSSHFKRTMDVSIEKQRKLVTSRDAFQRPPPHNFLFILLGAVLSISKALTININSPTNQGCV